MKTIIFSIIIFIILFIIYNNHYQYYLNNNIDKCNLNSNINNYLEGYWISDTDFLKIADIDNLIIYIDAINNFGYLIIIKNNSIIHNVEFTINIDNNSVNIDNENSLNNILFEISFNSNDPNFIWSNKLFKCILSINDGNLKLFNDDTLYANVFKENKLTYYIKNV